MMKIGSNFNRLWVLLLAGVLQAACTAGPDEPVSLSDRGEPVEVSFVMYKGSVVEEAVCRDTGGVTRAAATGAVDMAAGKMFRVYVYEVGSTDWMNPIATALYTVQADGTATGTMPLYRGRYDFYLFSYNSSTDTPSLSSGGVIDVYNGNDFMYNRLTGMTVQPGSAGETMMQAPLVTPFKRMGTQVQIRVRAKDGGQPVPPTSLKVNNVKVEGLPEKLSFRPDGTAWDAAANYNGSGFYYDNFTKNNYAVTEFRESSPEVLLPVDGSALLKFTVNLTVGYKDGDIDKTLTDDFEASVMKVMLPGMKYVFDFTLTFYGVLNPSDLTLAVQGYTEVELPSDDIGK